MRVQSHDELLLPNEVALWIEEPGKMPRRSFCRPVLPVDPDFPHPMEGLDPELWERFVDCLNRVVPYISSETSFVDLLLLLLVVGFPIQAILSFIRVSEFNYFVITLPLSFIVLVFLVVALAYFRYWMNVRRDRKLEAICKREDFNVHFRKCGYKATYRYMERSNGPCGDLYSQQHHSRVDEEGEEEEVRSFGDARVIAFEPVAQEGHQVMTSAAAKRLSLGEETVFSHNTEAEQELAAARIGSIDVSPV